MTAAPLRVFVSTGEASGELLAADLIGAMRKCGVSIDADGILKAWTTKVVPNRAQKIAASTRGCGTRPISGRAVTCSDSVTSTGRKAIRVMTELTRLPPRSSSVAENRMVSSCTRCEAPSMVRSRGQLTM